MHRRLLIFHMQQVSCIHVVTSALDRIISILSNVLGTIDIRDLNSHNLKSALSTTIIRDDIYSEIEFLHRVLSPLI